MSFECDVDNDKRQDILGEFNDGYRSTGFHINPNQFSHIDDDVSEQAAADTMVDTDIETEQEAREAALRLAKLVGYHVDVESFTERRDNRQYKQAFRVYPWSDKGGADA